MLRVAVLAGAFAVQALGSPVGLLLVLVATKTLIELPVHPREHVRLADPAR